MSLSIYLFLCLSSMESTYEFLRVFQNPPIAGKVIVNQLNGFSQLSMDKLKAIITILKDLKINEEEGQKTWFIEINKIFQEKSLRIFYLPLASLKKIILRGQFRKIPDPQNFLIGLNFKPNARVMKGRERKTSTKKSNSIKQKKRKSVGLNSSFNGGNCIPPVSKYRSNSRYRRYKT